VTSGIKRLNVTLCGRMGLFPGTTVLDELLRRVR
jgi:hypothetical protein